MNGKLRDQIQIVTKTQPEIEIENMDGSQNEFMSYTISVPFCVI